MDYLKFTEEQLTKQAYEITLSTARKRWQRKIIAAEQARIERDEAEKEYSRIYDQRPACSGQLTI